MSLTDDEAFSYAYDVLAQAETAWAGGYLIESAWELNKATRRAMAAWLRAQQGRAHLDLEEHWADPNMLLRQFEAQAHSRPERDFASRLTGKKMGSNRLLPKGA